MDNCFILSEDANAVFLLAMLDPTFGLILM